jgi:hypothetical protein
MMAMYFFKISGSCLKVVMVQKIRVSLYHSKYLKIHSKKAIIKKINHDIWPPQQQNN